MARIPSNHQLSYAYSDAHPNNFDLLRFVFASIVMFVHIHALTASQELKIFSAFLSSEFAVKGFFFISGFLIFKSYEGSQSNLFFFRKRLNRIYPAYFTVISLCTLAAFIYNHFYNSLAGGFLGTIKYYLYNLLFMNFLHPNLPGLFVSNPVSAVNGALWTLKIEVMFYLSVPLIVFWFRKVGRLKVLLALYIGSLIYTYFTLNLARTTGNAYYLELQRQFPGQLTYFLIGAAAYYYYHFIKKYLFYTISFAAIAYLFKSEITSVNAWHILEPLAIGVVVTYLAVMNKHFGNFGKHGDFSYGIYILHFPIVQTLVACGFFQPNVWLGFFMAVITTFFGAFLLWHLVEKKFLSVRKCFL